MTFDQYRGRVLRLIDKLDQESPRGIACIQDAVIDEVTKELFRAKLVTGKESNELLSHSSGPLGSHGSRLKLAYCLGWINQEVYKVAEQIHRIRNRMAHQLEVDNFDHELVRDLVENLNDYARVDNPSRKVLFLHAAGFVLSSIQSANQIPEGEAPE